MKQGILCPPVYYLGYTQREISQYLILVSSGFLLYKTNFDSRAFRSATPSVWNSLHHPVRASSTLSSSKRAIRTQYYQSFFHPSLH